MLHNKPTTIAMCSVLE